MAKSSHLARQKHSMREARKLKEIVARQRTGLIPGDGIVPGDEDAPVVRPVTTTPTPTPTPTPTTTVVRVIPTITSTVVRVTVPVRSTSPAAVLPPASTTSPVPVRSTTPVRTPPSSTAPVPTSRITTSSKARAFATNTVSSSSVSPSVSALPSESGSPTTGALAGGVIGGIALLALLSFGIVYYMRRFQKRKQNIAFEASSFRRSAILLDDSKSETKSNGAASSSPMQEKYISPTEHPFAPRFQFPTKPTNPSLYSGSYDQQGYPGGQENNLRVDTALPPPPIATSASPWGTAALVSAAAYGHSPYGMNSAPSPYSPYSQKHLQSDQQPPPSPMSAISYLPNPYADNERENPSPPSTVMVREHERQPPPSPVYGMHGQYVDLTRGSPLPPPPTINKPPTIRRKFFVQNPTPEPEETPQPSSQSRNNPQQAVSTDRKRPDTVYSTIYNPEDAYGGF